MVELGEPFGALWRLLVERHESKSAARLFKQVLQAVLRKGLETVRARLMWAIKEEEPLLALLGELPFDTKPTQDSRSSSFIIPSRFQHIEVEGPPASIFDVLLGGEP